MHPKDWLKHYLTHQDRQSLRDSGQPLYRYGMNDDEYKALQTALKNSALLDDVANITKISGWNAAFVIYAAEWWRREYDGSSWKWDKIFASFGASNQELTTPERNQLVKSGLQYWHRKVRIINGRTRYLGTIALEGGLPLRQLTNDGTNGGWLGTVLKQAIPKYIRLQASGVDASEIISEYDCIPRTYQNEQIYSILGEMVQTVAALKNKYQLHAQANPVSYLDQHSPSWRELFPLTN
ncbi:MAG: STY4851/ECs_5259 family protein [Methylococcales bacterium]